MKELKIDKQQFLCDLKVHIIDYEILTGADTHTVKCHQIEHFRQLFSGRFTSLRHQLETKPGESREDILSFLD